MPAPSSVRAVGFEKVAAVPIPSVTPEAPFPANVVTIPEGRTSLTRKLSLSPTYAFPALSRAMPAGPLNEAAVPRPSALEALPLPARVVTTPPGLILRTLRLLKSATNTFPAASSATDAAILKAAAVPTPSAKAPTPLPARVVTLPVGLIFRTLLPVSSPT